MRYSAFSLFRQGLRGHRDWPQAWRSPEPRPHYDVVIVGGGGHGLATAYYLAKEHGITNVAVLEKGWLGGGNTGRNTTVVRSNYLYPESVALYDFALRLYEGLSHDLNYNVMLSQRGMLMMAHSRHELDSCAHWANAMRLNGIDSVMLDAREVRALLPTVNVSPAARYPVLGGVLQPRGGIARHDAVAWGYARGADSRGVDIIQNCEVTGFVREGEKIVGVETTRGRIGAGRIGLAVAGHSSVLAAMAGFRLPISSYALQAMVSEPVKPFFDTVALSIATGIYLSQSDKGELVIGGGLDLFNSYAQRGSFTTIEKVISAAVELFPALGRLRLMRSWAGIVDVVHDSSPIIGKAPVDGLYLNCGWGTGGFKAIPVGGYTLAWTIAKDEPHPLAVPFGLDRFSTGALIDEAAASGIAH
jgi:sarcosine oxidase subunit beta